MKRKIFNSRTLALILVLAMAVSLFTISASAATSESLSGHGSNISTITATGVNYETVEYATSTGTRGTIYDYYLAVPAETANGTELTVVFTPAADVSSNFVISKFGSNVPNPPQGINYIYSGASNTYTATMTDGAALVTAYVHNDVRGSFGTFDTYAFHFYTSKPVSISTGDPVFIAWNGNTGTVAGRYGSNKIPGEFTLWVDTPTSVTVNGVAQSPALESETDDNRGYTITTSEENTLSIVVVAKGVTYTISCGTKSHTPAGSAPTSVVSYLPIGQFANNSGWGYLGTKFAGKTAPETTGVSLGSFGGFIEFKFENGITNDEKNPYGVDFVIYGNAFNGNPEAGAVQVSEDGTTWYELAGSNYYNGNFTYTPPTSGYSNVYSGTQRNTSVVYTKNTDVSKVYASLAGNTSVAFCPASWFPLTTTYTAFASNPAGGAHCGNISVNLSGNTLTFAGITAVADSNTNADYAFGYADVTPIGSPSQYGEAKNPYDTDKTGGDGFDLEWAVDISTGLPVDVTGKTFHYVRVYSAVLNLDRFGETSTEVTGVFTTANKSTASVGRTAAPTIKFGTTRLTTVSGHQNGAYVAKSATSDFKVSVTSDADNIFINGTRATSGEIYTFGLTSGSTQIVRIVTQSDGEAPYITYLKVN